MARKALVKCHEEVDDGIASSKGRCKWGIIGEGSVSPQGSQPEARRSAAWVGFLRRGISELPPHQLGDRGSVVSSPSGHGAELRPPSGFPVF